MRDIAVTLLVFGSLPFILRKPWIGIIVWTWLGFMNPHRMAWGFAMTMPFAYIVALTTILSLAMTSESRRIPWTRESVVLLIFIAWMVFTTFFAMYPDLAREQLIKVLKIQLMIFVAMILINNKYRLNLLVLTIALSIGFYGVKGGIFTILHGGAYRVQGPPGTFFDGNNETGLALAMTIPLLYYCARQMTQRWARLGFLGATTLTALAAIGTQSRGALLGMAAMGTLFWLKSKQKFLTALLAITAVGLVYVIMPAEWYERMSTIKTYEQDTSAQGRINAWWTAFNMAKARPLGGGFESFQYQTFQLYAPDRGNWRDVHSIYFQVMGHHGFIGFGIFMLLGVLTWMSASRLKRATAGQPDMHWLGDLAAMVQVSMVAYATSGAFLGLAYFDYYYNLILIIVAGQVILKRQQQARMTVAVAKPPAMQGANRGVAAGTAQVAKTGR